jgi:pimeloyl-ACP methyl ester carboxylesterase
MKTLTRIFLMMALAGMFFACEKADGFLEEEAIGLKMGNAPANAAGVGIDQERFVEMKDYDLTVHYRVIGRGPNIIVFIPGWTNPLTVYTKQFDYFRDKARCIYIDLPGHGLSDAPEGIEYTMELMADAIYDVLKKEGVKKFVGVGFSWGQSPLTQFEIKHPGMITKLILLDIGIPTWPPLTEELREYLYAVYSAMTYEDKVAALNGLIPPATAPADLLEWGQYFPEFPSWLLANMYYHYLAEEVCQPYAWDIPIMVIYTWIGPVRQARTELYFPGCEIHVVPGDQHVIQWAYHETVNPLMYDFVGHFPPGNQPL